MDKKSLKVKIILNLFGTYKEVRQVADITTTEASLSNSVEVYSKENLPESKQPENNFFP